MRTAHVLQPVKYNNATLTIIHLLRMLNVKVTSSSIIYQLESHPYYPSLYSIIDTLNKWRIETSAQYIQPDQVEKLPVPFIAHSKLNGGEFLLVTAVNGDIEFVNESGKKATKSKAVFFNEWTNVVLFAKPTRVSGEENYWKHRIQELSGKYSIPLLAMTCMGLFFLYNWQQASANSFMLLAILGLKLAGSIISVMLLIVEFGSNNSLLNKICALGNKSSCATVLMSPAAGIFRMKWSEIGFVYFTGGALILLLSSDVQSVITSLLWLSLFSPAFVVFSLVYQFVVIRQSCPFCLAILAILLTETSFSLFAQHGFNADGLASLRSIWLPLLCSFFVPAFILVKTKQPFKRSNQAKLLQKEINRLKYNNELFQVLLSKQEAVASPRGIGIQLGNPDAHHELIEVCNPYCIPCARSHKVIEELVHDNVRVKIIFTSATSKKDPTAKAVRLLMAIYKTEPGSITRVLNDWFNTYKMNYDNFSEKYKQVFVATTEEVNDMEKWCGGADVSYTPCFFLNGYKIPEIYQVTDIKHLLD